MTEVFENKNHDPKSGRFTGPGARFRRPKDEPPVPIAPAGPVWDWSKSADDQPGWVNQRSGVEKSGRRRFRRPKDEKPVPIAPPGRWAS